MPLESIQSVFETENVAEQLTQDERDTLAAKVKDQYEADLQSCRPRIEKLQRIMELAMMTIQNKAYPWNNASNVNYPLIAEAANTIGAILYSEVVRDGEVLKPKVIGSDDGVVQYYNGQIMMDEMGKPVKVGAGDKLARGERVCTLMNWQILEEMPWWERDVDKECHILPIIGTTFKKVYFDPIQKIPVSELLFPDKVIVNNSARDLESATVTQLIELYPQEVMERIRSGYFMDFDFDINGPAPFQLNSTPSLRSSRDAYEYDFRDQNTPHLFLEQHSWFDLDNDGFPEPYVVTVCSNERKVVRIVPRFRLKDIYYNQDKEVKFIRATQYFQVRRFLPAYDGSFYGIGWGELLYPLNLAVNTGINQTIDAATLSNTGGGMLASNIKVRGGDLVLKPGEFKMVDVAAGDLQSGVYMFPRPEPSQTMIAMLSSIIDAAKGLASMRDVLAGETPANIAATTYMGIVDQSMRQFKSIFKRYAKALKDEFKLIYDITSENITKKKYAKVLGIPEEMVNLKADFDEESFQIVPVADISAITSQQRLAQAAFLEKYLGDQFIDGVELRKRIFEMVKVNNFDKLIIIPQAGPPDVAQVLAQAEVMKSENKRAEIELDSYELKGNLEEKRMKSALMEAEIELRKAQALKTVSEIDISKQEFDLKLAAAATNAMAQRIKQDNEAFARAAQESNAKQEQEAQTPEPPETESSSSQAEYNRAAVERADSDSNQPNNS